MFLEKYFFNSLIALVIYPALILITISKCFGQDTVKIFDNSKLINKEWDLYKLTEYFNGNLEIRSDTCLNIYNPKYKPLNNFWDFNISFLKNSSFHYTRYDLSGRGEKIFQQIKGEWQLNENNMYVELKKSNSDTNPMFFGNMKLISLTDNFLIVEKTIDRKGNWVRTFYFRMVKEY